MSKDPVKTFVVFCLLFWGVDVIIIDEGGDVSCWQFSASILRFFCRSGDVGREMSQAEATACIQQRTVSRLFLATDCR